ncbi:MAG: hypothetical protein K8H75_13045 [Sulfuricella sp.]|nr:hypothetical protein [Sulfuricella sp.]
MKRNNPPQTIRAYSFLTNNRVLEFVRHVYPFHAATSRSHQPEYRLFIRHYSIFI